tara:strand:+ start:19 stop:588 length:570 start_codon:yes stop_codon:yes gene_type:complete
MNRRLVIKILLLISLTIIVIFIFKFYNKNEIVLNNKIDNENIDTNSNTIKDVNYISKDKSGNEYILFAKEGQIDISDNEKIFLTDVKAIINLSDNTKVEIKSDFGKYNIDNFDTIFSKNVIITYISNKITGDYVDFSLERNSLIISKNVVYTNLENMLKADVVEIDIKTKDTKIFMLEKEKKVNIKSKN